MGTFRPIRGRLDLGAFWLGDVLTYTHRLTVEPKYTAVASLISSLEVENVRISSIGFRLRGKDPYTPFHFQKQVGIHGRLYTK